MKELRKAFTGFHRQVEQVLAACPDVHKWAIVDRAALDRWTDRNVTLLGDACHPMTPYMAQGAAMAIEDAAVLSRCLDGVARDGIANAFRRFEATRKARTTRIQQTSRANTWLSGRTDADWVYGYNAWTVPLALPHQLVHGDLLGNVLYDDSLPPAVIDVSPAWRPARYADAIVVIDALGWSDASPDVLEPLADDEGLQLLVRARSKSSCDGMPDKARGADDDDRTSCHVMESVHSRRRGSAALYDGRARCRGGARASG